MIIYAEEEEVVEGKVDRQGRAAIKGKHGGFSASLFVLAMYAFENMATLPLAVNLVTYFNTEMHMDLAEAANTLTNFMGSSYILSLGVAFLADTVIGRYKANIVAGIVECLGFAVLALQAHFPKLKPPPCNIFDRTSVCEKVDGGNAALLYTGLYLIAAGTAGVKAALPSHGADQFDEKDPKESRQMSSFFNCLLLSICVGGVVSLTLIVWVQTNKGWDWGFGVPTIAMLLAVLSFLAGIPFYRFHVSKGTNALVEIVQVYVAAFRNRNLSLPDSPEELYEIDRDKESGMEVEFVPHRDIFRFLDKAAIQTPLPPPHFDSSNPCPWKLCRVTQVENAKIILGMIPIFLTTFIMSTCLAQLQTFSIQQGLTMDTRIGNALKIPPASLPIFPVIFLIIVIPVYDRLFVPLARKITGHPNGIPHLQRIGIGLVFSAISMSIAAILEVKRKQTAKRHGMLDAIPLLQPLPISVLWLSFQYFIFGIADMFTYVGLLEFFYSESPKALKAISSSFLWCSLAIGYFFSTVLVEVVNSATYGLTKSKGWLAGNNLNRNHLDLFYWLLAVLSMINFLNYLYWASWYKYRPQSSREVATANILGSTTTGKVADNVDGKSVIEMGN
ncbi:hypothetical protein ACLOJK_010718 [Asimina triloba]